MGVGLNDLQSPSAVFTGSVAGDKPSRTGSGGIVQNLVAGQVKRRE